MKQNGAARRRFFWLGAGNAREFGVSERSEKSALSGTAHAFSGRKRRFPVSIQSRYEALSLEEGDWLRNGCRWRHVPRAICPLKSNPPARTIPRQILFNNTLRSFSMFKKAIIAGAVLAAAFGTQAQTAPFASWTVTGTVTSPVCTIALAGGGVAAYASMTSVNVKTLPTATYNGNTVYQVPASFNKNVALTVSCPSPTAVALAFADGKAGTAVPLSAAAASTAFGLDVIGGVNVGSYHVNYSGLQVKPTTAATAAAPATKLVTTGTATGSSVWAVPTGFEATLVPPAKSLAFSSTAAATAPGTLTDITGNLVFQNLSLNKALVDASTVDIPLAGAGTITLVSL